MAGTYVCSPLTGTSASNFLYQRAARKCVPTQLTKTAWWECHSTVSIRPDLNLAEALKSTISVDLLPLKPLSENSRVWLTHYMAQQIVLPWWVRNMWTLRSNTLARKVSSRAGAKKISLSKVVHLTSKLTLYWNVCYFQSLLGLKQHWTYCLIVWDPNIFFCVRQKKESHTGPHSHTTCGWVNNIIFTFRLTIPLNDSYF